MKPLLQKFTALGIFICLYSSGIAQTHTWNNVAMGGGGFVSGIITNKKEPGLMYVRTDVGGAYRWNVATSSWIPLLDWTSENETSYQGVEALAIDPQLPNRVYMLVGTSYFNNGKTAIIRSTDYGQTFSITDVTTQFKAHGNGMGRNNGEKLQVDPNNSNILYCGTRRNGLFKSLDAGVTWFQVTALGTIVTPNDNGVAFVVIDSASGTTGNATPTMFVAISNTGTNLYQSTDAGATFSTISGGPTTLMPQRAVLASDKNLYITYADKEGPWNPGSGQVWKYNTQTTAWTNITPTGTTHPYSGISVDPANPQRLILSSINKYLLQYGSTYGDKMYLSTNGGTSWRDLTTGGIILDANGCTWISGQSIHWAGSIEFNPFNTNEAWVVSGNGIFLCSDLAASQTKWTFKATGMEETVSNDLVSIPGGPLVSVISDYDGFKHTDVAQYAPIHTPRMGTTTGLAYAAQNNNKLVRVGSRMYYTLNQGSTWTQCTINGTNGKVALSADGTVILHGPNSSTLMYRSVDNGSSWAICNGISTTSAVPVADPVNVNKFYAYNNSTGFVQVSTDGGVNFANAVSVGTNGSKIMRTAPGYEGHLWIAMYNGGLKRSVNSGTSFTTIAGVTACTAVGLGKAAPSAPYYTIYIWGRVNGITGVYSSIDEGANWTRLNDDAHEYGGPGNGQYVMGDMNVYGRVYMSTVGRGIAFADLNTALPVSMLSFSGVLTKKNEVALQWKTATETNSSYFILEKSLDGLYFTNTANIPTRALNGNSTMPLTYKYTDDVTGIAGTVYYRLKQVDKDGKFFYTSIISIKNNMAVYEGVQVFPNPVKGNNINLKIELANTKKVSLQILTVAGILIYQKNNMPLTAGSNLVKLPGNIINSKGGYVVKLLDESNSAIIGNSRFVIQ